MSRQIARGFGFGPGASGARSEGSCSATHALQSFSDRLVPSHAVFGSQGLFCSPSSSLLPSLSLSRAARQLAEPQLHLFLPQIRGCSKMDFKSLSG